jgi:hemolysin activation/secretion protein
MKARRRRRALVLAVALGALAAPGLAAAQAAPPPAASLPTPQQLNPAGQPQVQPPAPRRDLLEAPGQGACPLASSNLTFRLAAVEFQGLRSVPPADLAPAYAEFVGKDMPMSAMCEIRDRAAAIIFHNGILAAVNIPPQHIEGGKLVISVVEARIASVRVVGNAGPAQAKVEDYIEHLRGLAPFDLNTAQRYLLLASDIPGLHVTASLSPSPQGPGAVDMIVNVSREPVDGLVNVTNYGSKELGPWGALARIDINGLTPLGDRTSLVAYSTLFDDEQQVVQLAEEARLGSDGLLVRGSLSFGWDHPGAELTPLDLRGTSFVGSVVVLYPIIRERRENLNVSGGFDFVDQKSVLGGGGPALNDDKLRIFHLRFDGDVRENIGLGSDIAAGIEIRQGVDGLGASPPYATDVSRIGGRSDATVLRADGHWVTQWTSKFSTVVAFQAQWADLPVLSYEELQVGNLTIGRGYDPSSVAGDNGVSGSFEGRLGPYRVNSWATVQFYGFTDVARVDSLVDAADFSRTVVSAGGGVRIGLTPRLSLDVTYAHPFEGVSALLPVAPPARLLVSLVARFP